MRWFFVERSVGSAPRVGERVELDTEETRHLRTVLRLRDGDELVLTDGAGHKLTGVLAGGSRNSAKVELIAVDVAETEVAPPLVHLACAVVKGRRFEIALEKAVELGAHVITPLVTERGVVEPRPGKLQRWSHLLIAALKQCERCHLPRLQEATTLSALMIAAEGPVFFGVAPSDLVGERPLGATEAAAHAARQRLAGQAAPTVLTILIGPEGGWSEAEQQLLAARDAIPLTLGPHVLRTETAAAVGVGALQQLRRAWLAG